ncbi:uncharacterized protein LOC134817205 isoform X2 [Bolinopsis microptera]|uniref:uncharacterized protein LOC134817205 isoform X2 n=1 Tax=Bolinopsis microptera TaxID=2820187 RepID=UPI00307A26B2
MKCFLALVLLLSFQAVRSCEKVCKFLYNNPDEDWEDLDDESLTSFEEPVAQGTVTGFITIRLETSAPAEKYDFLRFISTADRQSQPLILLLANNGLKVGINEKLKIDGKKQPSVWVPKNLSNKIRYIQISDLDPGFYNVTIGDPERSAELKWNYQRQLTTLKLKDTVAIANIGRCSCTVYKYISACSDAIPRLCEEESNVIETVNLGSSSTLSCTGSGAPYLDVKWTKDGEPTDLVPNNIRSTTEADHIIESSLTLDIVTTEHLGIWTCTIFNKNSGYSVTKRYTLSYTNRVSLLSSPSDYYTGENTEFQWEVEGWPLDQVTLDCGRERAITTDNSGYNSFTPPRIVLTLTLQNQNVVTCFLKNGQTVLETRQITRVGYNCEVGERGVGKDCEPCPTGQTSVAGSEVCFPDVSDCSEGQYGYGTDCNQCTNGKTSRAKTKKVNGCFPDISDCSEGKYGYGSNCTQCPDEKTSFERTKKVNGCFPDTSDCSEGKYGYGSNCTQCPEEKTSFERTKKVNRCFADTSECSEGKYGYGSNCTQCPEEKTSFERTKKMAGCFPDISECSEGKYGYGFNCTQCPEEKTSFERTKKMAGCFPDTSDCSEGKYGYGSNCTQCPEEKTSFERTKKVNRCFADTSECSEGKYGYGFNCTQCPEEKTSFERTKKVNGCFADVSYCKEGQFGYGNDCNKCPHKKTSIERTKKMAGCFPDASDCFEGKYGYGSNCTQCPDEKTSFERTKKVNGCFADTSECSGGKYGYGFNCTQCPEENTSFERTKKVNGCFADVSYCKEGQYGYGNDCNECPYKKTSFALTKKVNGCFLNISSCKEGEFGYGSNCGPCPEGTTSSASTKLVGGCEKVKPNFYIPLGAGVSVFIILIAVILTTFIIIRKRRSARTSYELVSRFKPSTVPAVEVHRNADISKQGESGSQRDNHGTGSTPTMLDNFIVDNRYKSVGEKSKNREILRGLTLDSLINSSTVRQEKEEDHYANISDRQLLQQGNPDEEEEVLYINNDNLRSSSNTRTDEREDDTYATVELVQGSRLRNRKTVPLVKRPDVQYCTITELREKTTPDSHYINMDSK